MTIYETYFDPDTKEVLFNSEPTDFNDLDEVALIHGTPLVDRESYQVYPDGVLFSRFPWSLPSAEQATSDPIWAA